MTVLPFRIRWADALIASADGPVPEYGSAEWASLPDDDRRKVAACIEAAEKWRTRHHRDDAFPEAPIVRARRVRSARQPRPNDFAGGRVSWDEDGVAVSD